MTRATGETKAPEDTRIFIEASEASARIAEQLRKNAVLMARLGESLRKEAPRAVVTIGRGSSDNVATYAKYLIETETGTLTTSAAPSISSVYTTHPRLEAAIVLAISQSGRSPDLLAAVAAAKAAGARTIALVNAETSPLANLADECIPLHAGTESSVAATKSYLASAAAILHLVAEWKNDPTLISALQELPALLERAWQLDWTKGAEKLCSARDLYVIGRGLGFGLAQEAALKLKETCGLHAEAFSAAEVRHGPMALVKAGFPVLMFAQNDGTRPSVKALAANFAGTGADVLAAGFAFPAAVNLPALNAHPAVQPLLLAQSFYRMVCQLSRMRGFDADNPPMLKKITETM